MPNSSLRFTGLMGLALVICVLLFFWHAFKPQAHSGASAKESQIKVDHSGIHLDTHAPMFRGIEVAPVTTAPSLHNQEVPALVRPDARTTVEVFPPVTGRIIASNLLSGQHVTKGQTLAIMESGDFSQALTDYRNAVAQETFQKRVVTRAQDVLKIGGNAAKDLDTARFALSQAEAERQRADRRLKALGFAPDQLSSGQVEILSPIDGFVERTSFATGKNITDLTTSQAALEDLSHVEIEAYLPEDTIGVIKTGLAMHVTFDDLPGRRCDGDVARINPELQAGIRRIVARMICPNADGVLRPNMFAHATIDMPVPKMVLVPKSAIVMDNDQLIVFLQRAPGQFERRVVKASFDESDNVRVTEGLAPGDNVVTVGAIILNDAL